MAYNVQEQDEENELKTVDNVQERQYAGRRKRVKCVDTNEEKEQTAMGKESFATDGKVVTVVPGFVFIEDSCFEMTFAKYSEDWKNKTRDKMSLKHEKHIFLPCQTGRRTAVS